MKKYLPSLLIASTLLYSCGSSTKDKLTGSWAFADADKADRIVVFGNDNKCYSVNVKDKDTLMSATYSIVSDNKLVTVDSDNERVDTVHIIELTTGSLKIKTPDGDTVLLKKK